MTHNQSNPKHFVAKLNLQNSNIDLSALSFRIQAVQLPDFDFNTTVARKNGIKIVRSAGSLDWNPISIEVVIDEELETYETLVALANEYRDFKRSVEDSLQVFIYNNQRRHIVTLEYKEIVIQNIMGLNYDLRNLGETDMTSNIELEFGEFNFKRIKK